ncbi:MAG: ATP-binding protein, partial [Rhodospirillaceae bacterium]
VDPRHLKQVLINLLSNAVKFTSAGGQVQVHGERTPDGGLRISVSDDGIGIPVDEQARLFEPFARLHNPDALSQDGTGLGLFLVKSLIELNGGTVSLTSAPGKGTTVTVRFPAGRLVPAVPVAAD